MQSTKEEVLGEGSAELFIFKELGFDIQDDVYIS